MIGSMNQHWRRLALVIVTIFILTVPATMPPAQAQGNPNPGVLPVNATPFGRTYGDRVWRDF
jgi:hypothetical protein